MRRTKITVLAFACLLSTTIFSQSEEFQIVDSLKNKVSNSLFNSGEIEVFPIESVNAVCKKYEIVEVKDSIYESRLHQIDILRANNIELINKLITFNEDVQELVNAKEFLEQFNQDPEPSLMFKWQYLQKAQECLDKTSYKIDLYRSKDDVFSKSGGKTPYKVGNYVLKQQGQINDILKEGSYLKSRIEILAKKIIDKNNELMLVNKTKKVEMPTGEMDRTILQVGSTNIGTEIQGRFIKEDGPLDPYGQSDYAIMLKDYRHFVKNELVEEDSVKKYTNDTRGILNHVGGNSEYLIKNVDTGQLYYTTGDILRRWCMSSELTNLYAITDELKIDRVMIGDKEYVKYNGNQCVLTPDVSEKLLKKDASVIKQMQTSVEKYEALNKSATNLALKLMNHIKSYKSHLLTYDRFDEWKEDTKNCESVLSKMHSLPFASSMYFNRQLQEKEIEAHTAAIDYVNYSKEKLGL